MTERDDPFAILALAPTFDAAAVKRAYFAALQRHPPHSDPDGFRRVRAAYETLTAPGGLAVAFIETPVDAGAELARYRARFDRALAQAAVAAARSAADNTAVRRLKDVLVASSLEQALAAFGDS